MRVISFCADGIREAAAKGFYDWAVDQDADIICVQDLRAPESGLGAAKYNPDGYFSYFFDAIDGTTNGVAIYCRKLPKAIMTGLGLGEADGEGRFMQADFENISVACLLGPVASMEDTGSLARKSRFYEQLRTQLGARSAVHADTPGFLAAERQYLDGLYGELGYVDAFRVVNQDEDEFSWWPGGRAAGDGWRVDLQIVSAGLRGTIEYGALYKVQKFSSHAPLIMDYDIELERL